jgi:riboflavin kinase/FMN adenylyltransferase
MEVFNDFEFLTEIPNPVLTIGTFDGVHVGHQKILQRVKEEADKIGGESVLFTFYPHPRMVLYPDSHGLRLIQTQNEKLNKLQRVGLKNVIVHPFTKEFSRLTATEFVRDFLVNKLKVKKLVIGYDHQFGKNREGSIDFLKDVSDTYGFEVIEISAHEIDEVNVSSTKIRDAIKTGNIEIANEFLGEEYILQGKVVKGAAVGRTIGFPTANIDINDDTKLIPKSGVYAIRTYYNDTLYTGMLNIGIRPTVDDTFLRTIEVHIFDFNQDIYGERLTVQLLSRFRDEQKFQSVEDLRNQLEKDEKQIRSYFSTL